MEGTIYNVRQGSRPLLCLLDDTKLGHAGPPKPLQLKPYISPTTLTPNEKAAGTVESEVWKQVLVGVADVNRLRHGSKLALRFGLGPIGLRV